MIVYNYGETNQVDVTLTERVTISDPFFLLWLFNKTTDEVVKSFVTDTSLYTDRYNRFLVSLDLDEGEYLYRFYQKSTDANTDIDGERILEIGELKVVKNEAETIYYIP